MDDVKLGAKFDFQGFFVFAWLIWLLRAWPLGLSELSPPAGVGHADSEREDTAGQGENKDFSVDNILEYLRGKSKSDHSRLSFLFDWRCFR